MIFYNSHIFCVFQKIGGIIPEQVPDETFTLDQSEPVS